MAVTSLIPSDMQVLVVKANNAGKAPGICVKTKDAGQVPSIRGEWPL